MTPHLELKMTEQRKILVLDVTQMGNAIYAAAAIRHNELTELWNYMISISLSHLSDRGKNAMLKAVRDIPGILSTNPDTTEEELEQTTAEKEYDGADAIPGIHRQAITIIDNCLNIGLKDVRDLAETMGKIQSFLEKSLGTYFDIAVRYDSPALRERSSPRSTGTYPSPSKISLT